eukprot:NODE_3780_length_732_cov_75.297218_g3183_i0.p1 GENE.NODE_3780_length_732_cov_75.297218_g3183_i0~~NODE_3780_length_732_cov_75.297218_g3183_i0.p1  ORF type:complete len:133 (+),score=20.98 NODE_3780_length_732_cov_75.297218_g3183_i0:299-697(+)
MLKTALQLQELVVDRHPEGLEHLCRGSATALLAWRGLLHQVLQLLGAAQPAVLSALTDLTCLISPKGTANTRVHTFQRTQQHTHTHKVSGRAMCKSKIFRFSDFAHNDTAIHRSAGEPNFNDYHHSPSGECW